MSWKPIRLRDLARQDIDFAIDHYLREAGATVALRFIDALETANRSIAHHPTAGSARYAHELRLPGLRTRGVERYAYLIFYFERSEDIDVWRVLNAKRDIPRWMQE